MNSRRSFALATFAALSLAALPALADEYSETIAQFKKAGQSARFFNTAYGYAVFPTIGKAGIGVGGAYGKGHVYAKGKLIGDTTMTQLSVGFQLGGQGFSQIIFFENEAALKHFTQGEFEFGAQASAVAITLAAHAKAGSDGNTAGASVDPNKAKNVGEYQNGMAVFTLVKGGLMYEAAISGQKFKYKKR